jgi:hypothetical protein
MRAQRFIPCLLALLGSCLSGCTYANTFKRPYPEVESALLQRLDTAGKEPGTGSAWIDSRELARCLKKRGLIGISDYTPGQRIRLWTMERYDIGAIGHNELTIDVQRVDDRRTRITVDYLDRAIGFFLIPFAYASPGWVREPKIAKCLARLEGTPPESDRMPRRPPPVLREQSCEQIQGRSCGPPGAVIPCQAAGGQRIQCICDGVLSCR